ncbi:MAG: hypothetical protein SPJ06_05365 [Bacilli bacterium]|nr:hypothetical protein [Bacilli bacterium]
MKMNDYSNRSLTVPLSSSFVLASGDWETTFSPVPEYSTVKLDKSFLASFTFLPTTFGTSYMILSVHSKSFSKECFKCISIIVLVSLTLSIFK